MRTACSSPYGDLCLEGLPGQRPHWKEHGTRQPDRKWHHTESPPPVKIWPCPKIRLRVVINLNAEENSSFPWTVFDFSKSVKIEKGISTWNTKVWFLCRRSSILIHNLMLYNCYVIEGLTTIQSRSKKSWEKETGRFYLRGRGTSPPGLHCSEMRDFSSSLIGGPLVLQCLLGNINQENVTNDKQSNNLWCLGDTGCC